MRLAVTPWYGTTDGKLTLSLAALMVVLSALLAQSRLGLSITPAEDVVTPQTSGHLETSTTVVLSELAPLSLHAEAATAASGTDTEDVPEVPPSTAPEPEQPPPPEPAPAMDAPNRPLQLHLSGQLRLLLNRLR
jgi:hypothetical protein